jgi:hypothetical protein
MVADPKEVAQSIDKIQRERQSLTELEDSKKRPIRSGRLATESNDD